MLADSIRDQGSAVRMWAWADTLSGWPSVAPRPGDELRGCPHWESAHIWSAASNCWCQGSSAKVLIPEPQSSQAQDAVDDIVKQGGCGGGKDPGLWGGAEAQGCWAVVLRGAWGIRCVYIKRKHFIISMCVVAAFL